MLITLEIGLFFMKQTKKLARIALSGAFLFCTFYAFSNIIYLEAITLMVIAIALSYDTKDALLSCLVFGCLLFMLQGPTLWNLAYVVIYPVYSLLTSLLKPFLRKHNIAIVLWGFILAFSTGILLDLPFMLVNKTVTIVYIITSFKTSFIQGVLCSIEIITILEPITKILDKIKGEQSEKEY